MLRPYVMSRGGRLVHSPTAGLARLEKWRLDSTQRAYVFENTVELKLFGAPI